jgi:hypothetical protein
MSAPGSLCLFCSDEARERHHPTGRGSDGRYLDADFTVPFCVTHHHVEHVGWRAMDIAETATFGPTIARLCRLAWFVGRLADQGVPIMLDVATLRGLHSSLLRCCESVEEAA